VSGSARGTAALPAFIDPELATLVAEPPEGDEWVHEVKLDGYRILARADRGRVTLWTRRGKDWTGSMPDIARAIGALPVDRAWLDGEVVFMKRGRPSSFQELQNALGTGSRHVTYVAFDLLHLGARDVRALPLVDRKALLARLIGRSGPFLRFSRHARGSGRRAHDEACRRGFEGIVSKRAAAPYRSGRGRDWLKCKCLARQEFVVGGFTRPAGSRVGLGALLLGVYAGGRLAYVGRVGTGFTDRSLRDLVARLGPLEQAEPPFAPAPRGADAAGVRWVRPALVAEVAFTEWTADGRLRHPSFQGLREDKPPRDIVRERPARPER
jgi:bifunctional non-homologous end joining protein LigD